jgi:alpha-glucosidase
MRNTPIPEDRVQDPIARTLHPAVGRDPERTPMQWDPDPGAGFTEGQPWLPIGPDAERRSVALQARDRTSLLWLYRELIALRRRIPALHRGRYETLDSPDGVFAYERRSGESVARVALNFSEEPREADLGSGAVMAGLSTARGTPPPERCGRLVLGPSEGIVLALA